MAVSSINTNTHAGYAAANLSSAIDNSKVAARRLSGGEFHTKASDDAAGLSIGVGLRTDVSTLKAALVGAGQAGAILSIADGAASNIDLMLARLNSLGTQANSGAMGATEKTLIKAEMDALVSEVTRVAEDTKFNSAALLDGTFTAKDFQVGLGGADVITVGFATALTAAGLGVDSLDVTSDVPGALTAIGTAIGTLKTTRATIGALQSRFAFAAANIETSVLNTDAARASYMDADVATESTAFANEMVKIQASISVLAQVNQLPSNLLKVIG